MVSFFQRTLIWFFFSLAFIGAAAVQADKVFMLDGSVQESEKVWLSSEYVHFILSGTQGVEIRYAKEIVARVQIEGVEETIATPAPGNEPVLQEQKTPQRVKEPEKMDDKGSNSTPSDGTVLPSPARVVDRDIIHSHKGMQFYSPRRNQRYWAAKNSKHKSLNEALMALAQIYGQSVLWVENHMGAENDLGAIHQKLLLQQEQESGGAKLAETKPEPVVIPTPELGQVAKTVSGAMASDEESVPDGLEFYKPRREKKYWTGDEGRYDTLDEALGALAKQYGVTTEWIERHMGNTNNVSKIHKNLQDSLQ